MKRIRDIEYMTTMLTINEASIEFEHATNQSCKRVEAK